MLGVGIVSDGKCITERFREREASGDSNHLAVGVGGRVIGLCLPRTGGAAVGETGDDGTVGVPGEGV